MVGPVARYSAWPAEREQLLRLLVKSPGRYAAEIGCYRGATSRVLAEACQGLNKTLLCIDPWNHTQDNAGEEEYRDFQAAVAPFRGHVTVLRGAADEVALPADLDLGFVFIDGDHTAAADDMARYWPLLVKSGVMIVHDVFSDGWPRVKEAVRSFVGPRIWEYMDYRPTSAERKAACCGVSGLAWTIKG